jgi:zinc protease
MAALIATLAISCGPKQKPVDEVHPPDDHGVVTPPPDDEPPTEESTVIPTQTAQPQELVFPDEAFRAEQPKPAATRPFDLPTIKPFKLKSGIDVYLVEQHVLPIVSMDLTFAGGSISDPTGKEGLASVCMAMLSEGTESLDKIAFAEAVADVAASVDAYAGSDTQGVSLSSLSKYLDQVFPLFVDTLRHPGFRQVDFDRMIKRRLEALRQSKGSAPSIAGRVSSPVLYGDGHPFGRVTTEASLQAITLDDCRAYHAKWLKPQHARLFVVGDLDEAAVRARFDGDALKGWKGAPPKLAKPPAPKHRKGRIFFVDVPGAEQSEISVLHFGPARKAKDYYETWIMSSVLGGGFASRVNMNLREDKGYTYGARAGFAYSQYYGVFSGGGSVVTKSTYQSLIELHKEITAMQRNTAPTTADELSREKTGAVLAMPGRFATASASLSTFRSLVYYGLPLDYYAHFVQKIEKVSAKQVAAAAKKHLTPDDAIYVVVGDGTAPVITRNGDKDEPLMKDGQPVTLLDSLRDLADAGTLGKGGLVILDADAKPITP